MGLDPVRVGMIGVGRHARAILLPSLALSDELRLVALATAHEGTARAAEERYRCRCHVGHEALLADEAVEAVLVVGGRHEPQMLDALRAGKHVWCETPAVSTAEGARAIAAASAGRVVEVGFCLSYAPIYRELRRRLQQWREESPGPRMFQVRYYPYVGHFYHLLGFLNGPITAVSVLKSEVGQFVHLRFANGDTGSLTWTRFANTSLPYEEVTITGETGLLSVTDGRDLRFYHTREPVHSQELSIGTVDAELGTPTFSMPYGQLNHLYLRGYVPELEAFARHVRAGEPPEATIAQAYEALRVRQAIERAASSGGWELIEDA